MPIIMELETGFMLDGARADRVFFAKADGWTRELIEEMVRKLWK